ncbi:hypothetical protein [Methylophilus sp. Leaf408]|uniref:hypothetical protein n=1 Tax=Methylophilus sp. Leaf408 TaxID=2876561 RepID=UPI001E63C215|nr:hypothetical protein [Methylophilus sp. Leaf408]
MMRRWLMLGALGLTLLACWWVEQAEQPADTVTAASPRVQRRLPLAQVMPVLLADDPAIVPPDVVVADDASGVNLFSAMVMPAADTAVEAVSVPVSPYTYAGRLQEDGRWTVFLTDGQQQYVLHEGDHFAEGWKVAILDQQKVILQHAAERFEIRLDDKVDNGVVF